jgi:genome maintenance exonuclease 1
MNMQAIMDWRRKVGEEEANKITRKAANRGTKVHQLCEDYIADNPIDGKKYSITDVESFLALRKIIDDNIDNVHCQETRLYSDYLEVAGTVDCIAEFDGRLAVIDFKTARKLKKEEHIQNYFCQATAYSIMYEERTGIPVPYFVIIVTVDDEPPQVFRGKRNDYVKKLLEVRKQYKELKGV